MPNILTKSLIILSLSLPAMANDVKTIEYFQFFRNTYALPTGCQDLTEPSSTGQFIICHISDKDPIYINTEGQACETVEDIENRKLTSESLDIKVLRHFNLGELQLLEYVLTSKKSPEIKIYKRTVGSNNKCLSMNSGNREKLDLIYAGF